MTYETRVWFEDGTLMGVMEVVPLGKRWNVHTSEVDPSSGYAWPDLDFRTKEFAEDYARDWGAGYADHLREQCACGTSDCGAMREHGISIQYIRDGQSTDYYG